MNFIYLKSEELNILICCVKDFAISTFMCCVIDYGRSGVK